jgi:hypothetical protein
MQPLRSAASGDLATPQWQLRRLVGKATNDNHLVCAPSSSRLQSFEPFELYSVRQPNNCWCNCLNVLYSPAGGKAWALVSQDGYLIAVLGDATPAQRQALFAAHQ